jgi:hypothetical protein
MAEAIGLGDGCQASFFLDVRRFEMSVRDFEEFLAGSELLASKIRT